MAFGRPKTVVQSQSTKSSPAAPTRPRFSDTHFAALRDLDKLIVNRESLALVKGVVDRIDKCCHAIDHGHNLADLVNDAENFRQLRGLFSGAYSRTLPLLTAMALSDFSAKSFIIDEEITGDKKIDFLYRSVGGWAQFDVTVLVQFDPTTTQNRAPELVNAKKREHWQKLNKFPAGTMITVYLKTVQGKRSGSQEDLALDRYRAVFSTVQNQVEPEMKAQVPTPTAVPKVTPIQAKSAAKTQSPFAARFSKNSASQHGIPEGQTPALSFRVIVNKIDTVVHAGNAQLILTHIRDYQGQVAMFVLRDKKLQVRLDADSIWSAEIRNGEPVLFEFFGPAPADEFVKELAKKVNKYTQMDKLGSE